MGSRYVQPLRLAIQWIFLAYMLWLGVEFYRFVAYLHSGGTSPFSSRPAGIEGFLPISALLGLREMLSTGAINPVHPAALVIFLTVITVSLLLKRSFCSWICPVGTLSELLWKGGFTCFSRNFGPPSWVDRILRGVKYLLLIFFLYSIFWAMPLDGVRAFINSDYHKIADIRLLNFFLSLSKGSLALILIIIATSLPLRNPFCRFLCPYGALLGLISVLSPIKVTRDRKTCVSCGVCTQVCPAAIPVMAKERIHSEECIGCWRCISHCRAEGALGMKLTGKRIAVGGVVFATMVVALFWGGSLLGKWTGHWYSAITVADYLRMVGH